MPIALEILVFENQDENNHCQNCQGNKPSPDLPTTSSALWSILTIPFQNEVQNVLQSCIVLPSFLPLQEQQRLMWSATTLSGSETRQGHKDSAIRQNALLEYFLFITSIKGCIYRAVCHIIYAFFLKRCFWFGS